MDLLLADLGVTKSLSRPHVSDDNPYSEAQFKTPKYRPEFPARFGSIQGERNFCRTFFAWYNHDHYHSGIGLLTPAMVHYGQAATGLQKRHEVLEDAYAQHPERFIRHPPRPQPLLPKVLISNPVSAIELEEVVL
ncbi:MAG: integrase core domain-containing protein [Candidatus Eisenbacteria sp.]|nr:integrase core domain-containing protein [Candidatus Eisenbacteria bacterium]